MSNTPFREYKHWVHEGGISTPLIVHWPAGIKVGRAVLSAPQAPAASFQHTRQGLLIDQPGHLIDIMATCIDVSGATYPQLFSGQPIKPLQGVSLRPAFGGKPLARVEPIFWEHEGNRAVREGKWKLVAKENKPWELYDMEFDRTETYDVAGHHPDKVRELAAKWDSWAARANVLPLGGWRGKGPGGKSGPLSKELRFVLKAGDRLAREQAPAIVGRGFGVTVKFVASGRTGVLVAQGGSVHGYTLFVNAGKISFAVRRGGVMTSVSADLTTPGPHTASANLEMSGAMTLMLDGQLAAQGAAPGPLAVMPRDALNVGADEGGAVGPYAAPNRFGGTIESVVIELDDAEP